MFVNGAGELTTAYKALDLAQDAEVQKPFAPPPSSVSTL